MPTTKKTVQFAFSAHRPAAGAATASRTFIEPEPVPSSWPRPGIVRGRFQCHSRRPPNTRTHEHALAAARTVYRAPQVHVFAHDRRRRRRARARTYHRRPNVSVDDPFLPPHAAAWQLGLVYPRVRLLRTQPIHVYPHAHV